jgi:D-alanyl-D-alanine carboxypeptidase (penicillin-binding protein 5/6)
MWNRCGMCFISIVLVFALIIPTGAVAEEKATEVDLTPESRSAIVMDVDTGTILYEKSIHDKLPMASITKIMTMLLIMEALDREEITMDTKVRTSEYAASMGGSQIFLETGEEMIVKDMLKGIAIASGNDASVAMAEHLAGSEQAFVELMNKRAQELGMDDTHFSNSNGLPTANHHSSAHDIAIMSRELLKHEEITEFTSIYQDYLRKDSAKPFWLVNTNKLVRFYAGVDGLKTGYTSESKFCLAATAKRGSFRVISVVMGAPNTKTRNAETSKMLDYSFSQFTNMPIFKSGDVITQVKVDKGQQSAVILTAPHQFSVLMKKGDKASDYRHEVVVPELKAPIQKGDIVGKVVVYKADEEVASMNLAIDQHVLKASWWTLFKRTAKGMFVIESEETEPVEPDQPSTNEPEQKPADKSPSGDK